MPKFFPVTNLRRCLLNRVGLAVVLVSLIRYFCDLAKPSFDKKDNNLRQFSFPLQLLFGRDASALSKTGKSSCLENIRGRLIRERKQKKAI